MGETFANLGGPKDFNNDAELIDTLMPKSPKAPHHNQTPEFTQSLLNNLLSSAKPRTVVGPHETNCHLFPIYPPHIKTMLHAICIYFLTHTIPNLCLSAKTIPLYKKDDPQIALNYRPITLLITIYQIISSYAAHIITFLSLEHTLLSQPKFGGLPNHRCTDHLFSMISNLSTNRNLYDLYANLNKAFNSVPHKALFHILHNYNFPPQIMSLIQQRHRHPADLASVNNHTLQEAMCLWPSPRVPSITHSLLPLRGSHS